MRKVGIICVLLLLKNTMWAQVPDLPANVKEALESATENNQDIETEDDSWLQSLQQFIKDPINLNTADAEELERLQLLSSLQIQNIITYRKKFGNFIDIYELQSVPTLDIATIEKMRPFVTVSGDGDMASLNKRFRGGIHSVLIRAEQTLESSKGYLLNDSTATNFYPGSPQNLFVRYTYSYKNLLQYGFLGEKDAGEQFFKGAQQQGFDFYSAHLFARNIGLVKDLALGDFVVNMGQGLTQWQSLAFKKGGDVINVKRQSPILVPYNSSGEIYFHRGAGITLEKNNWQVTAFASYRKLDANFNVDTIANDDFVSSLETSGYHRTKDEVADKGVLHQTALGGNISFNPDRFHLGINTIQYHFNLPLEKDNYPYNLYALSGNHFGNSSVDYSYTFKNMHLYGEAAVTNKMYNAFVNGLLISLDPNVDMSFLYRNISPQYQSLYTNAFTESSYPTNEKGFYSGISIHPNNGWRLDAYADFYSFPWLKYQVNAPSYGSDYYVELTYSPSKLLSIYSRYKNETKSGNDNNTSYALSPVVADPLQDWRSEISYKITPSLLMRNRIEMLWYDKGQPDEETGFLSFIDLIIKPLIKKYSGSMRLQYFETDSYNSRVYAYEDDVLYSYSIPVFYGKGIRYYFNLKYDVNKRLAVWFRWAQTIYKDQNSIGTGLDEIQGNKRTELKLQGIYQF
jgi:helix-hairpin-helix protein